MTGATMTSRTGVSSRSSSGTPTAFLMWITPTTSSLSAPSTGNREWPVRRVRVMTSLIGSSACTVRIRIRGVITSSAVRSPNSNERCTSVAVSCDRVPCSADRPTSENSSWAERAEASSSCGEMPSRRSTAFAVAFRKRISSPVARVNIRCGPCTALAVPSG